jgi:hypothetical protein
VSDLAVLKARQGAHRCLAQGKTNRSLEGFRKQTHTKRSSDRNGTFERVQVDLDLVLCSVGHRSEWFPADPACRLRLKIKSRRLKAFILYCTVLGSMSHTNQEPTSAEAPTLLGFTVHDDSEVFETEPVRQGGLIRKETASAIPTFCKANHLTICPEAYVPSTS